MNINKISIAALALLISIGLTACEKGPAEKAGEKNRQRYRKSRR